MTCHFLCYGVLSSLARVVHFTRTGHLWEGQWAVGVLWETNTMGTNLWAGKGGKLAIWGSFFRELDHFILRLAHAFIDLLITEFYSGLLREHYLKTRVAYSVDRPKDKYHE